MKAPAEGCAAAGGRDGRWVNLPRIAWAGLLLAVLLPALVPAADSGLKVGDPPPAVSLLDLHGFPMRIPADVRGKIAVVHFWTDYCEFCLVEMPAMENLYRKYRRQGLVILAVNVGQKKDAVKAFVTNVRVTYPVLLDSDMKAARRYGVDVVPRTFFLDRNGIIRYRILGDASETDLEHLVQSLL